MILPFLFQVQALVVIDILLMILLTAYNPNEDYTFDITGGKSRYRYVLSDATAVPQKLPLQGQTSTFHCHLRLKKANYINRTKTS